MASSAAHMTPQERTSSFSLASIFALRMFGLFIILPVFAVYARELPGGDSETLVGITLGIYGLTQGLLQIPFGVASDRLGRKPVIIFGLIIFALGSFLAASGANIWIVMLGRMVQGLSPPQLPRSSQTAYAYRSSLRQWPWSAPL